MSQISSENTDRQILGDILGGIGIISLNKPARLNALSLDMFRDIYQYLCDWESDDNVRAVLIKSTSEKAFCAGGDVKDAAEEANAARSGDVHGQMVRDLFREEYILNSKINHYPKPYISLLNGIVMGGGVGISLHGSHKIVSDTTKCAMPETKIGFFPDIGFGAFYKDMPGRTGLYMAMTSAMVSGQDMMALGLATHMIPHADWDALTQELIDSDDIEGVLSPYSIIERPYYLLQEKIDHYFRFNTVAEIMETLSSETEDEWCKQTYQTILERCPMSVKVSLAHYLKAVSADSFDEVIHMDYRLSQNMAWRRDFYEGVRALLIDKDMNPRWSPGRLGSIHDSDVDALFGPCQNGEQDISV